MKMENPKNTIKRLNNIIEALKAEKDRLRQENQLLKQNYSNLYRQCIWKKRLIIILKPLYSKIKKIFFHEKNSSSL